MIRRKEMTTLIVNAITAKMVLTYPKVIIENSGSAAWLQALFNTVVAFVLFYITARIYKGGKNIIMLSRELGGRFLGILTGLIVFSVFLMNFSSVIRVFPDMIREVLLQDFSAEFIAIIFLAVIGIGAFMGIEAIARVNFLVMPVIGGVLVLFLLFLLPNYRINNIFPVLGTGVGKIFVSGFNTLSLYGDLLLLNIFLPLMSDSGELKKCGKRTIFISAAVIISILIAFCLACPYPVSAEFMIPIYRLTKMIHLGSFLSRFEPVFQFVWTLLLFLYSSIYIYALVYVWQTAFNLKYNRPLILPVLLISAAVSFFEMGYVVNIAIYTVSFLLPLIFSFVARVDYKRREKTGEKA